MKFKKILVTGMNKSEFDQEFLDQVKSLCEILIFAEDDVDVFNENIEDTDCLIAKFNAIGEDIISKASKLKFIGVYGTGTGKIDLEFAKSRGIIVTNIPGFSSQSVAEFVFASLLEYMRELERAKVQVRNGNYLESGFSASEIRGKNLGIIGLGSIGKRVGEIALGFGANVSYYSRNKVEKIDERIKYQAFKELIATSDIISIHVPLTDETEGLFGVENLEKIKKGSIVINTSKMEIFDLGVLDKKLENGDVSFILDHADEMDEKDIKMLSKHKNCIIYPPIAYISNEAMELKKVMFIENLENYLKGSPVNVV